MFSSAGSALTGLQASARRVEAVASNIANARNSIRTEDAAVEGVTPQREPRDPAVYRPVRVHQETLSSGGVRSEFVPVEPPHRLVYRPDDRLADGAGHVARPNVDDAAELVELRRAENAYRASLKVVATENEMIGVLLDEIR